LLSYIELFSGTNPGDYKSRCILHRQKTCLPRFQKLEVRLRGLCLFSRGSAPLGVPPVVSPIPAARQTANGHTSCWHKPPQDLQSSVSAGDSNCRPGFFSEGFVDDVKFSYPQTNTLAWYGSISIMMPSSPASTS
jgi:hypothetical protein